MTEQGAWFDHLYIRWVELPNGGAYEVWSVDGQGRRRRYSNRRYATYEQAYAAVQFILG